MENFVLWSPSLDKDAKRLSFFAGQVQMQGIAKGTRQMVETMLDELGVGSLPVTRWTIRYFVTNYLADDLESDDWEDIWGNTWEIRLPGVDAVEHEWSPDELVRSWADDETWDGETPEPPLPCVLFADFVDEDAVLEAERVLTGISELKDRRESDGGGSSGDDANARARLLSEIQDAYRGHEPADGRRSLRVARRPGVPRQLVISLGEFDEDFFAAGTPVAELVSELVHALGGTTTWDERDSPAEDG